MVTLLHGRDPFRRNSKGILPIDATKDETIKRLIEQATESTNSDDSDSWVSQLPASVVSNGNPGIKPGDLPRTTLAWTVNTHISPEPAPSMKGS